MTPSEVADVLEDVADALFVFGRCKGVGQDPDGSLCVRGGVAVALGLDPQHVMGQPGLREIDSVLGRYLAAHLDALGAECALTFPQWVAEGRFPAWVWNDRTDDDAHVIDTIRRCAKAVRNGELEVA